MTRPGELNTCLVGEPVRIASGHLYQVVRLLTDDIQTVQLRDANEINSRGRIFVKLPGLDEFQRLGDIVN